MENKFKTRLGYLINEEDGCNNRGGERAFLENVKFLYQCVERKNLSLNEFISEVNKVWKYDSACLDVWALKVIAKSEKMKMHGIGYWIENFLSQKRKEESYSEYFFLERIERVLYEDKSLYEGVKTKEEVREFLEDYFSICFDEAIEYSFSKLSSSLARLIELEINLNGNIAPKIICFNNVFKDEKFIENIVNISLDNIEIAKKRIAKESYLNKSSERFFNKGFNIYLTKFIKSIGFNPDKLPYIQFKFKRSQIRFLKERHHFVEFVTTIGTCFELYYFISTATSDTMFSNILIALFLTIPLLLLKFPKLSLNYDIQLYEEKNGNIEKSFSADSIEFPKKKHLEKTAKESFFIPETLSVNEKFFDKLNNVTDNLIKKQQEEETTFALLEEIAEYKKNRNRMIDLGEKDNVRSFEICLLSFLDYLLEKETFDITNEDIERGERLFSKINNHYKEVIEEKAKEFKELKDSELNIIENEIDYLINNR